VFFGLQRSASLSFTRTPDIITASVDVLNFITTETNAQSVMDEYGMVIKVYYMLSAFLES
jgi:hypothetical protein